MEKRLANWVLRLHSQNRRLGSQKGSNLSIAFPRSVRFVSLPSTSVPLLSSLLPLSSRNRDPNTVASSTSFRLS